MTHRGLQSPVLEGMEGGEGSMGAVPGGVAEDMKGVVRGLPPQMHQQPLRLNSFGEESLDSLLGDTMGMCILKAAFFDLLCCTVYSDSSLYHSFEFSMPTSLTVCLIHVPIFQTSLKSTVLCLKV